METTLDDRPPHNQVSTNSIERYENFRYGNEIISDKELPAAMSWGLSHQDLIAFFLANSPVAVYKCHITCGSYWSVQRNNT